MADKNETLVSLKIQADMGELKKTLQQINNTIKSALKAQVDLTFNIRGEKQIQAMKQRIAKEIKIPVSFQNNGKPPVSQVPSPQNPVTPNVPATGLKSALGKMSDLQNQISSAVSGGVLIGFARGMANGIREVGSQFENLKVMLENALGGVAEGAALMEIIRETANAVQLPIAEVGSGFNKLINRGLKPTKNEFIQLTDVAKSQGKSIEQYIEAVLDAMTGENERLKEFGIKAKDAGDSWIYTFKGVSAQIKKNEQDIYNYMVSLGLLPGVMGASSEAAKTFNGILASMKSKIDSMKIAIFTKIKDALVPLLNIIVKVLDKISIWVEKNPQIAAGITMVLTAVAGLTGLFLILIPIITSIVSIGGVLIAKFIGLAAIIGTTILVLWDLWNGLATGESYIFAIIDGFLEWLGIGVTVQDMINGITEAFNFVADVVVNYVVPVILEVWNFLCESVMLYMETLQEYISVIIDIIVSLFTGNIPRAGEGFVQLKNIALNIFDTIVSAAANAVSHILSLFADGVSKIGDMLSGLPIVGDFFGGIAKGAESKLRGMANKAGNYSKNKTEDVRNRKNQIREYSKAGNTGKDRKQLPGNKKGEGVDPYRNMKSGNGSNSAGSKKPKTGGGGGKKPKSSGGKGTKDKNKENIEEQKAIVTAIESLQDILKKTGYDITSEIKRANLFEAKRKAILDTQRKEGAMELFKNMKDRFFGNKGNTENNTRIEIKFDSNGKVSNIPSVNSETRLGELYKINYSRSGG